MTYQSYIARIRKQIPASALRELTDFDDDIEQASAFEIDNENGIQRANTWIQELQEQLSRITVHGAAANALERVINILIPCGWLYHAEASEALFSPSKGGEGITYQTVELRDADLEYVKISEGRGNRLEWNVSQLPITNNLPLFVASVPAWELDLTCKVPSLETKITHRETSRRVMNADRQQDRWQRAINIDNRQAIAAFFDRNNSFFANPVIIHIQTSNHVTLSADRNTLAVELNFFNADGISTFEGKDQRPFVIIDGQHRVRGSANSIHNSGNLIPVIIMSDDMSAHTGGRIFSEINTLSTPLSDKHRLFLAHRFAVKSPNLSYTFGTPGPNDDPGLFQRDRANRLSYETAARLLRESEFWERRIKILDQNVGHGQVLSIEKWLEYSFSWFTDYPYTSHNQLDEDQRFSEIVAYFEAWGDIIDIDAWHSANIDSLLFKSKTQARVLLRRFPQVYEICKRIFPDVEILNKDHFSRVLSPLTHIPFDNVELLEKYREGFTPEVNWQLLDVWIEDAIDNQVQYTSEEILDENLRGLSGRGIISMPLQNYEYEIPPEGLNPSVDGNTRYLAISRPPNALHKCKIEFWHDGEELASAGASWKTRVIRDDERIPIRNRGVVLSTLRDLKMRVKWQTIRGWAQHDFVIKE